MRLDKYLKVSMVIKRRTVAKDLADAGLVIVNGKVAKPNTEVKINDVIEITFGSKKIKGRVTSVDNKDFFKNSMFENIEA
ncbi:MAG: RNA-binding S4 domain-containing protein [Erysipelotrichaceae bacterium]|nr:RNA-binding S4 domain-containing protein [Erysipelotrichaceae bacterium]